MRVLLREIIFSLLITGGLSYVFQKYDGLLSWVEYNRVADKLKFNPYRVTNDPSAKQKVVVNRKEETGLLIKVLPSPEETEYIGRTEIFRVCWFRFEFLPSETCLTVLFEELGREFSLLEVSGKVFSVPTGEKPPGHAWLYAIDLTREPPATVREIVDMMTTPYENGIGFELCIDWVRKIFDSAQHQPGLSEECTLHGRKLTKYTSRPIIMYENVLQKLYDLKELLPRFLPWAVDGAYLLSE